MKRFALYAIALAGLSGVVVAATSQTHPESTRMPSLHRPKAIRWQDGPPALPKGAKFAVLEGDPTKNGPFTMRVKAPDGYRIPPHTHPKTERITVISGTFSLGMGSRFDASKMEELPAGTYGYWPAGMKHYAAAKGETVVQLHGIGPWQINYLNPADDPRNAPK